MNSDHEALWRDPASWKGGALYYRPEDPRVIVPKRWRIGWTINFAHPNAIPVLFGAMASVIVPAVLVILGLNAFGVRETRPYVCGVTMVTVVAVIALWIWGQRALGRKP